MVLLLFLLIMLLVAADRADQQDQPEEKKAEKAGNSSVFAQQINGMDQDGIIPSKAEPVRSVEAATSAPVAFARAWMKPLLRR